MSKDIIVELQFFLISILWGALILASYDVLRIFRRVIKHNYFFIAIEDLLFWVITSVFIFAMIYNENNGIIRGFSIMGMALGMVIYHYLLSKFVVKLISELILLILRPFRFVDKCLKKFSKFLVNKFKKISKMLWVRLKKISKSVKITLNEKRNKRLAKRKIIRDKKKVIAKQKKEAKMQKKGNGQKEAKSQKEVKSKKKHKIKNKENIKSKSKAKKPK